MIVSDATEGCMIVSDDAEECMIVSDDTEEYVTTSDNILDSEIEWTNEAAGKTEELWMLIQQAIDDETEVTITLHEDIVLDQMIWISQGKTVTMAAAEGKEVSILCDEEFCGPIFLVEKGGKLIVEEHVLLDEMDVFDCNDDGYDVAADMLVDMNMNAIDAVYDGILQYAIEDQMVLSGSAIADLLIPEYAVDMLGERVNGKVYWAATEGGSALPEDMELCGADGDIMELFWTFYPDENGTEYLPVSGKVTLTFVMGIIRECVQMDDENLWNEVGTLTDAASSSGVTQGEEYVTEVNGVSVSDTNGSAENSAESSDTTKAEENGTSQILVSRTGASQSGTTQTSTIQTGTTQTGTTQTGITQSGTKTGSSVTISKTNPLTGDQTKISKWVTMEIIAGIVGTTETLRRNRARKKAVRYM